MIASLAQDSPPRRVCLILDGSHPFASGGVSTRIRQIVRAMPDIEFSLHYCGDRTDHSARPDDGLPGNVTSITTSHFSGQYDPVQSKPGSGSRRQKDAFFDLIHTFMEAPEMRPRLEALCRAAVMLRDQPGIFTLADLLGDPTSWRLFTEHYVLHLPNAPLHRCHNTISELATALWNLLHTAITLPAADVYHGTGTGCVGLLGALAAQLHHVPLLLSEAAVSLHERIDDLRRSPSPARPDLASPFHGEFDPVSSLRIGFLELLSQIATSRATRLTAVSKDDARAQVDLGAPADCITIVPNGIDTTRFASIARDNLQDGPPSDARITVGFLGRIVPIKDIKTLLRAARLVLKSHPETRFILAGPTDAAPHYFAECLTLADQLGISQSVEFPGRSNLDDFLVRSDIVVLTSVSGGLPYILLEASAAGLPVVATDVGSCREMIVEPLPGHPTLGPSGIITEIADPAGTAKALNQLISNADLRFEHGMNGLRRIQSASRQEDGITGLRRLYVSLLPRDASTRPHAVI